jgi:hypothetical protein
MIIVSGLRAGFVIGLMDPARRVALEQEVRQRRKQHARGIGGFPHQPDVLFYVGLGYATDEEIGDECSISFGKPLLGAFGSADANLALVENVLDDPLLRLGAAERLGEQLFGKEDLDAAIAHRLHEHVVLGFGALYPQHIVEQQLFRIRRGQPAMLEARSVHNHPAQRADLGLDSQCHSDLLEGRSVR